MHYCSPPGPLDQIHDRDLNELKNMKCHPELRIAAAMDYCAEDKICPPPWVVKEAAALIRDLLMREKTAKRGRTAGSIARYRQDQWDVERWDAVEAIRRVREKTKYDSRLRRQYGETPENSRAMYHHERTLAWLRQGTFVCASQYLAGRKARVGADAVKASYRRCIRRAGKGPRPDRYYVFDERFLRKLGFPGLQDREQGTKLLPLYDLT